MIGVLKFSESVVVRRPLDPGIENPDFFQRGKIVIDDHAAAANDGHLPNLPWVEPTTVDDGCSLPAKIKAHACNVLDTRSNMSTAQTIHTHRLLPNEVLNNGDIVRRQVPRDVDVFLEKAQVEAAGGDIPEIAQVTRIDDLLDFSHGG